MHNRRSSPSSSSVYLYKYISVCVSGMISLRHWASATERVLNLGLPWRVLRPQLVSNTQYGMVDYQQWMREFSITEPKLEVSLVQLVSVCVLFFMFYFFLTASLNRACTELQNPD